MKKKIQLFVYGTLRKGYANHSFFLKNAKFMGHYKTKDKFLMSCNGVPYINKNIPKSNIIGEVYQISYPTLYYVDVLEGHPRWYYREIIKCINIKDNTKTNAYIYFNNAIGSVIIDTGDFNKK